MKIDTFNNINTNVMNNDKDIKKVAEEYEAFYARQMLEIAMKHTNIAGEGAGSDIIKSMYIEQIANQSKGQLGISQMLYEHLSKENKSDK